MPILYIGGVYALATIQQPSKESNNPTTYCRAILLAFVASRANADLPAIHFLVPITLTLTQNQQTINWVFVGLGKLQNSHPKLERSAVVVTILGSFANLLPLYLLIVLCSFQQSSLSSSSSAKSAVAPTLFISRGGNGNQPVASLNHQCRPATFSMALLLHQLETNRLTKL